MADQICSRCGDSFEPWDICKECNEEVTSQAISFIPGSGDHMREVVEAAHLKLCETRAYLEWPEGYTGDQIMGVVMEALDILSAALWPAKESETHHDGRA